MAAVARSHSQTHRPRQGAGRPYCVPTRPENPYCSGTSSRQEKYRVQAQQRRMTQKGLMEELAWQLPFPREVISQMDAKTTLCLALCYFRLKTLLSEQGSSHSPLPSPPDPDHWQQQQEEEAVPAVVAAHTGKQPVAVDTKAHRPRPAATGQSQCGGNKVVRGRSQGGRNKVVRGTSGAATEISMAGIMQNLLLEALDGFLMVVSCEGTVLYLSDTVHYHTGLFQSEHTGGSLYDLVHEEDHGDVREALTAAEAAALTSGVAPCSFFCRMRSKKKHTHLKTPGYKLVYISGHCRVHPLEPYVACTVNSVSAHSILEVRMEGNMFITRHNMDMKITFYDGRLCEVLGYSKKDLIGRSIFSLHHHDDYIVTVTCSEKVRQKGESVTGYYRFLTLRGGFVWLQTRGTLVVDKRTGKPSQVICMHFVIDKERGERDLSLRGMLADRPSHQYTVSSDPLPVPRWDGEPLNPLSPAGPKTRQEHAVPDVVTRHVDNDVNGVDLHTTSQNDADAFGVGLGSQDMLSQPRVGVKVFTSDLSNQPMAAQSGTFVPNFADNREPVAAVLQDSVKQFDANHSRPELVSGSSASFDPPTFQFSSSPSLSPLFPLLNDCPPIVGELEQQVPLPDTPTLSHIRSSATETISSRVILTQGNPSSTYSTPAPSPYWSADSSPFPYPHSHSASPHSAPTSSTSPQAMSVPHSSETSDWKLLDSLASHLQLSAVFDSSVSPDSGCEDLECYLNTLTGSVPSTFAPSGTLEEAIQIQSSANSSPSSIALGHSPTVTQQNHSHCISNSISVHMHQISPLVAQLPNSAHHHHHTGCDASHGSSMLRGLLSTTPQSSPSSPSHPHHMDLC